MFYCIWGNIQQSKSTISVSESMPVSVFPFHFELGGLKSVLYNHILFRIILTALSKLFK